MDTFDDIETLHSTPDRSRGTLWNILTILMLVGILFVAAGFLYVFMNPQSGINPFPPPTLPQPLEFPTLTPTERGKLPPTWTPNPTATWTVTPTLRPSSTPIPTNTQYVKPTLTSTVPTDVPGKKIPTATPSGMSFVVQQGNPVAIKGEAFHPEEGCNWMGVAGQVFDLRGSPLRSQVVQLGGSLGGTIFTDQPTITGLLLQYGAGYYEFKLADKPVASKETLYVQLVDQAGLPMSDKISFDTFDSCEKNMVVINFRQVK